MVAKHSSYDILGWLAGCWFADWLAGLMHGLLTSTIKERKNGQIATKIGSTLDNSDITTWLFLEAHESRKTKLQDRIRKGRPICVQGYLREYRKDDDDSPYRAIVASDFSTRKDRPRGGQNPATNGSAAGYAEVDPTPDY